MLSLSLWRSSGAALVGRSINCEVACGTSGSEKLVDYVDAGEHLSNMLQPLKLSVTVADPFQPGCPLVPIAGQRFRIDVRYGSRSLGLRISAQVYLLLITEASTGL